jgi:hypothetical protein
LGVRAAAHAASKVRLRALLLELHTSQFVKYA